MSIFSLPLRPPWDETTTAEQLEQDEKESFLAWRRGLAKYVLHVGGSYSDVQIKQIIKDIRINNQSTGVHFLSIALQCFYLNGHKKNIITN